MEQKVKIPGRGAKGNPANRFEPLALAPDPEAAEEARGTETRFFVDSSRSLISENDSPDVGFSASVNPYRGCEHGCIYCYARPFHEYLGLSAGLDFETRIFVKQDAPALLRAELMKKSWQPRPIAFSGVTDCYQPVEKRLGLTRACLEVLAEFRNPAVIITKNRLVTRDIDILSRLAEIGGISVYVSVTSLDPDLSRRMEPRCSAPRLRLEAIRTLAQAGIPVGVMAAPMVPGLTDHELPAILEAAAEAGAKSANFILLRLPHGVSDLFQDWLEEHYPLRKEKVLAHIRETREGALNQSGFGQRMRGTGPYAENLRRLFELARRKHGLDGRLPPLSAEHFLRPGGQMSLF
jgi:DNA repair photolyase